MIKITFHPDSDITDVLLATGEYQNIWNTEGEKIVIAWERKTGLKF